MDRNAIIGWLLEGDPAIRWQAMRDLLDPSAAEIHAERQRVTREGWGAALLSRQRPSLPRRRPPSSRWRRAKCASPERAVVSRSFAPKKH